MIEVAEATSDDQQLRFSVGVAENLPHPDAAFDLVVSTTSLTTCQTGGPDALSVSGSQGQTANSCSTSRVSVIVRLSTVGVHPTVSL